MQKAAAAAEGGAAAANSGTALAASTGRAAEGPINSAKSASLGDVGMTRPLPVPRLRLPGDRRARDTGGASGLEYEKKKLVNDEKALNGQFKQDGGTGELCAIEWTDRQKRTEPPKKVHLAGSLFCGLFWDGAAWSGQTDI